MAQNKNWLNWSQRPQPQKRNMDLKDLQEIIDKETREKNNAQGAGKGQSEQWGIRALDMTNEFRKQNGKLPSLSWN